MKKSCQTPCKECPFRKDSLPGWLGENSHNPQVFIDAMEHNIIPCHMRVDWDEAEQKNLIVEGKDNPCIGALQFSANSLKLPRGAREMGSVYHALIDNAKQNPEVFKWGADFIKHHS